MDVFLRRQPQTRRAIFEAVRRIAKKAISGVAEALKWGRPTFLLGREKLAFVYCYPDYVNVGFFRGTELDDPHDLLKGTARACGT